MRGCLALVLPMAALLGCGGPPGGGGDDDGNDLPLETWSWVDVPGMVCGNGSPTGVAINPSERSRRLVLLFEGGGACWEAASCYGILVPVTASHLDGFNAQTFESMVRPTLDAFWMLQRSDPASPFGDATFVFVPYCTGDLHAGTQDTVYEALGQQRTMHHRGADNVDAMLARVARYEPSEVFTLGVSAGGYGVQLNWDRIAAAFPGVTTHAFADGAQLVSFEAARWGTILQRWAMRFPAGCSDCASGLANVAAHWRSTSPPGGGRLALIASLQDAVLRAYFGYDAPGMRQASLAIGGAMTGTQAAFMLDNDTHTRLGAPESATSTGVVLRPWVEAWANGTAAFHTVGP